jgi:hypothetical protein
MAWPVNARTSAMMDEAQALYGATITATQGSPSTGVSASAGTHNGQGVIDVVGADLDAIVIAMRQVGFAAWHRTTAQGFTPHVHGVAVGEPGLSDPAGQQVSSYFAGYNGLAANGPDDGPRTWVGVTWETYTGSPEIPTGDRPTGTPFWGESLPVDDWDVTTGSPQYFDSDDDAQTFPAPLAVQKHDTGSGNESDAYMSASAGDQILWIVGDSGTYLSGSESPLFKWVIRARGTGTLSLTDDVDPSWSYAPAPANPLAGITVTGSAWTDYEVTTTTPTAAGIVDGDGTRLSVTVDSGAVDIVWVALAVRPQNGTLGGYGPEESSPDQDVQADPNVRGAVTGSDDHTENSSNPAVGWEDARLQAIDNMGTAFSPAAPGITLGAGYETGINEFDEGLWQFNLGYIPIDVGVGTITPDFTGTEGIDYIRRPDRTVYDDDAYWQYSSGLPFVSTWFHNVVSFDMDFDDYGSDWLLRQTKYRQIPFSGTVDVPDLYLGPILAQDSAAFDTQHGLGLTSADSRFGLAFYSSLVHDLPLPTTPPAALTVDLGQYRIYLGEADFAEDPSTWEPLTARVAIPGFKLWKPGLYGDRPDDPDSPMTVRYLRNRQRNDGLGGWSTPRTKGTSSRQLSLHNRGYE